MFEPTEPTEPRLQAHHSGYKSWTTTWYDENRKRRMRRFGKETDTTQKVAFSRWKNWKQTQWDKKPHVRSPDGDEARFTVRHLADAFEERSSKVYVKGGKSTSYIYQVKSALSYLRDHIGDVPAIDTPVPKIAEIRDAMIWSGDAPLKRNTVNDRLAIIKRCYAWGCTEKGLIPPGLAWAISQVESLKSFRSEAAESEKIYPVSDGIIQATAKESGSVVADLIWMIRLSGMRPGEACDMRVRDIDDYHNVWLYRPVIHKTQHHGKTREIYLGPKAQEIVVRRRKDGYEYLFRPSDSVLEAGGFITEEIRDHYDARSLRQAIHRACKRAFDQDGKLEEQGDCSYLWNPNQLRHQWATEVRREFGIESASIGLGHSDIRTTEIYAERDKQKGMDVASKIG